MTDAAVLRIDGERKMLKVGQSFQGVTLVAALSSTATLEVDGETLELGLSRRIGTSYETSAPQVVTIPRDAMMQYQTTAIINGRSMPVLVDTGANVVALNSAHAQALGVDYSSGAPRRVETASGTVNAWMSPCSRSASAESGWIMCRPRWSRVIFPPRSCWV